MKWIAVVAALFASPAVAERFVVVSMNLDAGTMVAINLDSVKSVQGEQRGWIMTAVVDPNPAKTFWSLDLTGFDCNADRSRVLASKIFDRNSDSMGELPQSAWQFPTPTTPTYDAMLFACGKQPRKEEELNLTPVQVFEGFRNAVAEHRAGVVR